MYSVVIRGLGKFIYLSPVSDILVLLKIHSSLKIRCFLLLQESKKTVAVVAMR